MAYYPTLVIGIGPTGNYELRRIKKNLLDRDRDGVYDKVHLLWVGLNQPQMGSVSLADLDAIEMIEINPDYGAINRAFSADSKTRESYPWWQPGDPEKKLTRTDGRMAFFWETQFKGNRGFADLRNEYKKNLLYQSNTSYRVFILASPAEPEAAMIFDLAWELREQETTAWLFLQPLSSRLPDDELYASQYAFMRELRRFTSNDLQVIDRGASHAELYDRALFQGVFVYDDPLANDAVADQLSVFMEQEVALSLNEDIRVTFSKVQDQARFVISSSDSYTLLLPSADIHRYIGSRLAFENLFLAEPNSIVSLGLMPVTKVKGSNDFLGAQTDSRDAVSRFLKDDLKEGITTLPAYPFQMIAFAANQQWPNRAAVLPSDIKSAFQDRLQVFLNNELNQLTARKDNIGGLVWVEGFLKEIIKKFDEAEFTLLQNQKKDAAARLLFSNLETFRLVVGEYQAQIKTWKEAILKHIYPEVQKLFCDAQKNLRTALEGNPTRRAILPNIPKIAEDPDPGAYYYRELIPLPQGKQAMDLGRGLLVWHWDQDASQKAVLSIELSDPVNQSEKEVFTSERLFSNTQQFTKFWVDSHIQLTRFVIDHISLMPQIDKNQVSINNQQIHPLLEYDPLPGNGQRHKSYIVGKGSQDIKNWASQSALSISGEGIFESDFGDWITYIQVHHNIPTETLHLLNQKKASSFVPSRCYVFACEQYAADIEAKIRALKKSSSLKKKSKKDTGITTDDLPDKPFFEPDFVRLMVDPGAFETMMKVVYLDWLKPQTDDFGKTQWIITTGDNNIRPIKLKSISNARENQLMGAIKSILMSDPQQYDEHPFSQNNFGRTMVKLQVAVDHAEKDADSPGKGTAGIVERIRGWSQDSSSLFAGLVLFQKYLYLKGQ